MTSKRKMLNLTTTERFVTAACFSSLRVFCFPAAHFEAVLPLSVHQTHNGRTAGQIPHQAKWKIRQVNDSNHKKSTICLLCFKRAMRRVELKNQEFSNCQGPQNMMIPLWETPFPSIHYFYIQILYIFYFYYICFVIFTYPLLCINL